MKLIFKNTLLLFLLIGLIAVDAQGTTVSNPDKSEFTKTIKKNFNMKADGDVTLVNKYGDINLKTWNRNEVNIEITITVNAKSESYANETFERIDINFSDGSDYVKAETNIESANKSSWWGGGNDSKSDFRIDYVVSMPDAASLNLNNKYGNSNIEAVGGDANIVVKYGDFNLASVGADTKINLGYGNAKIGKINGAEVEVKYSKIKLQEARQMTIDSKYSKIYVEKATKVKCSSKYDNYDFGELTELSNQGKYDHFEIEKIEKITAFSKYTDFEIDELSQEGTFELKYGGMKVENLKKGFDKILLDCEYTDCKIYMDDDVDFELDVVTNYASVSHPSGMDISYEKKKSSSHEVQGHRGSKNGGKIKVRLSYGGIKVR